MALKIWAEINWKVCERKRLWHKLRDSPCIYKKGLRKITERPYEGNRCAIRGMFRSQFIG
jgi:hypothetical protein